MNAALGINWLHLSDLHVGMTDQGWMWPAFKHRFFSDLAQMHGRTGPWHLVLFTGDLTQRGLEPEFSRLTEILQELFAHLRKLGSNPVFFCVPGNHDLIRPDSLDPEARVLLQWWDFRDVQGDVFQNAGSRYLAAIKDAFGTFVEWQSQLAEHGVPCLDLEYGLMPGDSAGRLVVEGHSVGIVGLNSAWLQLSDGDFRGRLHVDPRQLLAVTGGDTDHWCGQNHVNLLITHHPSSWLHPKSVATWDSEVAPAGRFDAHLFGHMHEPDSLSVSRGGGAAKTHVQAASIFGLESYGNETQRIQGYSLNRISRRGSDVVLRTWPRIGRYKRDGSYSLVPNHDFELDADNGFDQVTRRSVELTPLSAQEQPAADREVKLIDKTKDRYLEKTEVVLVANEAHVKVRTVEQNLVGVALKEERVAWIQADWGMGEEGFLWSLQQSLGFGGSKTYRLDLSAYRDRVSFSDRLVDEIGCSLSQYCELLSSAGTCLLVLDDPVFTELSEPSILGDIAEVTKIIQQYCPSVHIVVLIRQRTYGRQDVVRLNPLDEADTRAYIDAHHLGGASLANSDTVSQLHRHTDGVPSRIDSALKELEVASLSELLSSNSDVEVLENPEQGAPPALVSSIAELASPDSARVLQRTFSLLKTLSMFPQGEQLIRIKRFLGVHPYMPAHARELLDRGLVDSVPIVQVGRPEGAEAAKILLVRRTVRDYVRSLMTEDEQSAANEQALDLYFGPQWRSGKYKTSSAGRFNSPATARAEVSNASMVLLRLIRSAAAKGSRSKVRQALGVAYFLATQLRDGGHYRGVVSLYEDIRASLEGGEYSAELDLLKHRYAQSLRMLSDRKAAIRVFRELLGSNIQNRVKTDIHLSLALCYDQEKQSDDAVRHAKFAVAQADADSGVALQAQAMLVRYGEIVDEGSLRAIEASARKKKRHVVANNIALERAATLGFENYDAIEECLRPVLASAAECGDHYNLLRARIRLARSLRAAGRPIRTEERQWLMEAYQYLHGQRLAHLFDECHELLWTVFEETRDTPNLLRLFRFSSIVWRLESREVLEAQYLQRTLPSLVQPAMPSLRAADKETAYFLTRLQFSTGAASIAGDTPPR